MSAEAKTTPVLDVSTLRTGKIKRKCVFLTVSLVSRRFHVSVDIACRRRYFLADSRGSFTKFVRRVIYGAVSWVVTEILAAPASTGHVAFINSGLPRKASGQH